MTKIKAVNEADPRFIEPAFADPGGESALRTSSKSNPDEADDEAEEE